jgi:hypothetical protein
LLASNCALELGNKLFSDFFLKGDIYLGLLALTEGGGAWGILNYFCSQTPFFPPACCASLRCKFIVAGIDNSASYFPIKFRYTAPLSRLCKLQTNPIFIHILVASGEKARQTQKIGRIYRGTHFSTARMGSISFLIIYAIRKVECSGKSLMVCWKI